MLERAKVAEEMKALDQEGRAALRQLGIRFGAFHLYVPALLKPAPRALAAQLWTLKHGGPELAGLDDIAHLAASGRTSFPVDKAIPKGLYRAAGYRVCGERAVRVDILERLADLIRPAIAYRPGLTQGTPPTGTADQDGFVATGAMTSLVGCAGEDFASILRSLGYVSVKRPGPAITVPLATPPAPKPAAAAETPAGETAAGDAPAGETEPVAALNETAAADVEATETADAPILTESEIAPEPTPEVEAAPEPVPADLLSALKPVEEDTATASETPATGDETAAPGEAAAPEAAAAPAEPELIEVWRPHRHQGGRRPEPGQRNASREGAPREGAPGERAPGGRRGDRPNRGPRPGGPRRDETQAPAVAAAPGEAAAAPAPRPEREPRRDERPRQGQRGPRPDQAQGRPEQGRGPRPDFKRDGRPGGPRREDRGGAERFQQPARPVSREPDPDSPFAKLAALKAQLEGRKP